LAQRHCAEQEGR